MDYDIGDQFGVSVLCFLVHIPYVNMYHILTGERGVDVESTFHLIACFVHNSAFI